MSGEFTAGVEAMRSAALTMLKDRIAEQKETNRKYPDHARSYPSWEQPIIWMAWIAADLSSIPVANATTPSQDSTADTTAPKPTEAAR